MTNRITHQKTARWRESGNVFFALFGAVGLVGVLGAASMTILKGPVAGMQKVTKYTVAENAMIAAGRLSIVAANADCDDDAVNEPLEWADAGAEPAPSGGGLIPSTIGAAKQDPWGNTYGYCVWDHGAAIAHAGCGGASQNRLAGDADIESDAGGIVIALISSGPDRVFQTSCGDDPDYVTKPSGSDDIVLTYTYGEASDLAGGLWQPKGDETAEIARDLEVYSAADPNTQIFGLDSASDPTKPSIKVDFIQKLSAGASGVTFLSDLLVDGGKVGIGTSSPTYPLTIASPSGPAMIHAIGAGNSTDFSGIRLASDEETDKVWQIVHRKGAPNINKLMHYYYNGSTWINPMTIQTDGNVGIGTATPSHQLHVLNGGRLGGLQIGQADGSGTSVDMAYPYESIGTYNPDHNLRIQSGNRIHFHTGMGTSEPNNDSKVRMVIGPTGNVGIGTASPTRLLHIVGSGEAAMLESTGLFSSLRFKANSTGASKDLLIHYGGNTAAYQNQLRFGRYAYDGGAWEANPILFDMDAPANSLMVRKDGWTLIGDGTAGHGLHVNDSSTKYYQMLATNNNASGHAGFMARHGANSGFHLGQRSDGVGFLSNYAGTILYNTRGTGAHIFRTTNSNLTRFTVENDGRLNAHSNRIINLATPTAGSDAATKAYVDTTAADAAAAAADNLGNHTATQNLNMANKKIVSLAGPTAGTDAATKAYVDLTAASAASAAADNLGNHTATQNLNIGGYNIVGSNGLLLETNVASGVLDDGTSDAPYSRVHAHSFHTQGTGMGQMYIEGYAIDANMPIRIGKGLAGGQSAQDVEIGDNTEIYVDTSANSVGIGTWSPSAKLHVAGTGKFTGALDMTLQKITNLANPTAAQDAATKSYVDTAVGAGGGDADTLSGMSATSAATANTIMARNGNADTWVRYLHSQYVNMSHSAATRNADTVFYSSTDDYIRKNTAAGFRTSLDVYSKGEASGLFVPSSRTLTAGTGITGGGNLTANRTFNFDTTWGDARYTNKAGDTMTGNLFFSGGTRYTGTSSNNNFIIRTNNADRLTITAAGAATFSGNLTVGGTLSMGGSKVTNVANPTAAQDAATKAYVDLAAAGAADNLGNHTATQTLAMGAYGITSSAGTIRDGNGGWVRTYGNTGWYNGTHGGGWYMTDTSWLRAYNNKNILTGGIIRADNGFQVDGFQTINANGSELQLRNTTASGFTSIRMDGAESTKTLRLHYGGSSDNVLRFGSYADNFSATWNGNPVRFDLDAPDGTLVVEEAGSVKIGGQLNVSSNKIINVADPTAAQDAATKAYVDTAVGAGGGDADTLSGMSATSAATANTIMARNGNADTWVRYLHSQYVNMSHAEATRNTDTIFYSSVDNYIRKNNAAGFRTSLDVYSKGEASGLFVPTSRTLTAGTGITGGGNLTANRTFNFDTIWGDARYTNKAGDTMTGNLFFSGGTRYTGTSSNNNFIIRTNNADRLTITAAGAATFSGNLTVGGTLSMGGSKVTNVANPTAAQDAATKAYVDANAGISEVTTAFCNALSSPCTASCPAGYFRTGCSAFSPNSSLNYGAYPSSGATGCTCQGTTDTGVNCYAYCAK